jgi:hypothetical protein
MTASDVLHTIKSKIKDIFGHDSLSWFDYPYIVDWQVLCPSEKMMFPNELQDRRDRILCSRQLHSGPASLREGLLP